MRLPISDQYRLQTYLISCTFRDIAFDGSKIVIFAHLLRLTLPNQSINQLISQLVHLYGSSKAGLKYAYDWNYNAVAQYTERVIDSYTVRMEGMIF